MRDHYAIDLIDQKIREADGSLKAAKAVRAEQKMQARLAPGIENSFEEAEELIARVMGRDDPFEQGEVLRDINAALKHENIGDKLASKGYGPATKSTAADVLARLKSN